MQAIEPKEIRLKRLRMRSWRRGMKEMDMILGRFADDAMVRLSAAELDDYEALLSENDQDLYRWITAGMQGNSDADPPELATILARIIRHAALSLSDSR